MRGPSRPSPTRNPRPRSSVGAGGCDFAVHPAASAKTLAVFWMPEADLATVVLAPLPSAAGAISEGLADIDTARSRRAADAWCLVQGRGVSAVHLALISGARPDRPLAALVSLDADAPLRLASASRLWRNLHAGASRPADPLTVQKRRRMKSMLRAVDGRVCGASHRQIAQAIFGAGRTASEPWKTSALRDATMRLVRDGHLMIDGGYRSLLRPRRVR